MTSGPARGFDPARYRRSLGNRRLRGTPHLRALLREVHLDHRQFIQPLFVVENIPEKQDISGIPGTYRDAPDSLIRQVESDLRAGVSKFLLFGIPAPESRRLRDFDPSFTAGQIAALKARFGEDIWLAADVCLCASTRHGHCGILDDSGGHVLNPDSVQALAEMAAAYADAGADCVAPSDMMDGRIDAIRAALDDCGHERTLIMSYAAKFASGFYGPFRGACESSPGNDLRLKDRKTYQLDYARPQDAMACALRDAQEGADILMVKPVIHYLDVLRDISDRIDLPFAAYYVSGEHAMVEAAAAQGLIDGPRAHVEAWHAIRRAGATAIITYAARFAPAWLAARED